MITDEESRTSLEDILLTVHHRTHVWFHGGHISYINGKKI